MKAMSIVGIIWFSLSLVLIAALINTNAQAAEGWGVIGMLYAIPYSIVGLVTASKKDKGDQLQDFLRLQELKDKGFFTDEEFQERKADLLKK